MTERKTMEEYLNGPNVPIFLKPVSSPTVYTNVDLSDPAKYNDKNYKYHQYFANLNNNISFKPTFYPDDSFGYYKTHKVFRPANRDRPDTPDKFENTERSFQSFDSFIDVPTLFSDEQMAGVSYQTAVDMVDGVYLFGGLQALLTDEYEKKLRQITNDFTIPPENIKMVCDYDIPLPLDKEKIESIALKSCNNVRKYLTESKSFKFVCELNDPAAEDTTDEEERSNNNGKTPANGDRLGLKLEAFANLGSITKTNTLSNSSAYLNTTPRSTICSSASRLSDRFFMIYGGLEIDTIITYPDDQHCVIEKVLTPNDQFWLFDRIKCKFREIKLSVHPTYSTIFPNSTPRFAHSVACVAMDDNASVSKNVLDDPNYIEPGIEQDISTRHPLNSSYTKPATMFVMGGYKLSISGRSFVAMNDLWKLDFFLDANGTADEAVASPIGNFNLTNDVFSYIVDENLNELQSKKPIPGFSGVYSHSKEAEASNWPPPRGFFSMCLIDTKALSEYINWRKNDNTPTEENSESHLHRPSPIRRSALNNSYSVATMRNTAKIASNSSSSKTEFRIKDMFKRKNDTVTTTGTDTVTKGINSTSVNDPALSSNSSGKESSASQSSHSSPSRSSSFAHTYKNAALRGKCLLICGGSSILYTKVMDDEFFDVYYNNNMLDDIWIFDFQTEKWYNFDNCFKFEKRLTICGHTMLASSSSLKLVGGIEAGHYPEQTFQVIQAGIYNNEEDDGRVQIINWDKGREIAEKFRLARTGSRNTMTFLKSVGVGRGKDLNKCFGEYHNYYSNYAFQLDSLQWKLIRTAIVQDAEFFAPWTEDQTAKVVCGGMVDDTNLKDKRNLININILYTHSYAFIKDSKIVVFSPDVKIIDRKTNNYIKGSQTLVGNGIYELYSVYL